MTRRILGSVVALAAVAAVGALVVVPVSGQGSPAPPALVVTAFGGAQPPPTRCLAHRGAIPIFKVCGQVTT